MEFDDDIDENDNDLDSQVYNEKEYDLDILFDEAQNEKNTESQIEQYENIINLEMSTSNERKYSFRSFEQLTLIYLSLLNKDKFIFNFKIRSNIFKRHNDKNNFNNYNRIYS